MAKHKDLQPWLDYFDMLHTYEENGFLLMKPMSHSLHSIRCRRALHV